MRTIVIKLKLDDSGWEKDDHDTLADALKNFLFKEIGSAKEVEILSDSNEEEPLNLDAMMSLA